MNPDEIVEAMHIAVHTEDFEALRVAALDASKFLRSRLSEAAYSGECHHCNEVEPAEPCLWCGLVRQ